MSGAGWFVAYTQALSENRAQRFLDWNGAETYSPKIVKTTTHAGSVKTRAVPLFPRYVFFRSCPIEAARNCPGVSHLMKKGLELVLVPDTVIDSIRVREGRDGYVVLDPPPDTRKPLIKGHKVKIEGGALHGRYAIYQGMADHERVSVLVKILRRGLSVDLPISQVTAV